MTHKISKKYCSGSKYVGDCDIDWNGKGIYTYPDGTEYHGEFKNGNFHGEGTMITPQKFRLTGTFENGKCKEYTQLTFPCGLEYTEENWTYCKAPDRRYAIEIENGIPPVYESYETKEKPATKIPKGYYDNEEGFMNPINASIYQYTDIEKYIRTVSTEEEEWIKRTCRFNKREYNLDENILNENDKALKQVTDTIFDEQRTSLFDKLKRKKPTLSKQALNRPSIRSIPHGSFRK